MPFSHTASSNDPLIAMSSPTLRAPHHFFIFFAPLLQLCLVHDLKRLHRPLKKLLFIKNHARFKVRVFEEKG